MALVFNWFHETKLYWTAVIFIIHVVAFRSSTFYIYDNYTVRMCSMLHSQHLAKCICMKMLNFYIDVFHKMQNNIQSEMMNFSLVVLFIAVFC